MHIGECGFSDRGAGCSKAPNPAQNGEIETPSLATCGDVKRPPCARRRIARGGRLHSSPLLRLSLTCMKDASRGGDGTVASACPAPRLHCGAPEAIFCKSHSKSTGRVHSVETTRRSLPRHTPLSTIWAPHRTHNRCPSYDIFSRIKHFVFAPRHSTPSLTLQTHISLQAPWKSLKHTKR